MNTHTPAKANPLVQTVAARTMIEPISALFFVLGLLLAATLMHSTLHL